METRNALIDSYHNEVLKLFKRQLKNLHLLLLSSFDEVLKDTITKDDSEFSSFTSNKRQEHEMDFLGAAKKTAIDDANWGWEDEFQELKSGPGREDKSLQKVKTGARANSSHGRRVAYFYQMDENQGYSISRRKVDSRSRH